MLPLISFLPQVDGKTSWKESGFKSYFNERDLALKNPENFNDFFQPPLELRKFSFSLKVTLIVKKLPLRDNYFEYRVLRVSVTRARAPSTVKNDFRDILNAE